MKIELTADFHYFSHSYIDLMFERENLSQIYSLSSGWKGFFVIEERYFQKFDNFR